MLNYTSNYTIYYILYCIFTNDFTIYYMFPASDELQRIWLDRIVSHYPKFKISKTSLVCSKHFAEIDFIKTTRSKSFSPCKDAVPLMFYVDECVYMLNETKVL